MAAPKPTHRMVSGLHSVRECLRVRPESIFQVWFDRVAIERSPVLKELQKEAQKRNVKIFLKDEGALRKEAGQHQGVLLFVNDQPRLDFDRLFSQEKATVLFLDGVEDPHNLGAVLRTAWLMRVDALFIPEDRSASLTPAAHKVASGGAEHVPVIPLTSFYATFEELKRNDFWVFGLSHKASKKLSDLKIPPKVAWILGSEDKGLRSTSERACDELVRIEQVDANASFNVSVAAAITLFESNRQRAF